MHEYELMLIFPSELTEEKCDAIIDSFDVDVTGRQKIGKRLFANPIHKRREGYYVLCEITADKKKMKELTQKLNINDSVIRYLTVAK